MSEGYWRSQEKLTKCQLIVSEPIYQNRRPLFILTNPLYILIFCEKLIAESIPFDLQEPMNHETQFTTPELTESKPQKSI